LDFWYAALIDKIGMQSMIVETDMAGNYVGSSCWLQQLDWVWLAFICTKEIEWRTIV
jgi:hypothetical protein